MRAGRIRSRFVEPSVLPGFAPTMGFTLFYLGLVVLLPLAALILRSATTSWAEFWAMVTTPRLMASYRLTFGTSFLGAVINAVLGFIVAWVLVRYSFPGKRILDAIVDLPFALPTAVSGIALTTIYAPNGWIGRLLEPWGVKVAYTPLGILIAMTFIGLPFVVRTLQPAIEEIESETEEASASLGASRAQTFRKVLFPVLLPALLTGFALAFARALGEYGSVIFISGNMPMRTEIAALQIVTKLDQYDYQGAAAIGTVMLAISFVLLLIINLLQRWTGRRNA